MVASILPTNSVSDSYEVSNSLRFNDGDNPKLAQTFGSAGNRRTWTWSAWIKRGVLGTRQTIFSQSATTDNVQWVEVRFEDNDKIAVSRYSAGIFTTNQVFRDPNAWLHIVVAFDTTQSTDTNRVKLYINGSQVTDVSAGTYPPEDSLTGMNQDSAHHIGDLAHDGAFNADFQICEVFSVDGTQHLPTVFGEFNTNGVWVPIDAKGDLTFGTNGYYLEFQQTGTSANSSGMGADTSGNDHHFTPTNLAAVDVIVDTCTNNFATLNPLSSNNATLSEGNVEGIRASSGSSFSAVSTIAPSNGKWYFEYENTASQNSQVAIVNLDVWPSGTDLYDFPANESCAVLIEANANYNITFAQAAAGNTTLQNSANLVTAKYGFAVDIDNNDLYVSANGNWYGGSSFNQSDFSNATAVTTDLPSNAPLAFGVNGSLASTIYINFGNPGGDDSISSGNSDANGYGNFEYAVPSGFYALCTKNLAEYG